MLKLNFTKRHILSKKFSQTANPKSMMSSLNLQYLVLKINYLKHLKNLKNLNFSKTYEQNLPRMIKISRIKYFQTQGLVQTKQNLMI